jgi:hypothetical protein
MVIAPQVENRTGFSICLITEGAIPSGLPRIYENWLAGNAEQAYTGLRLFLIHNITVGLHNKYTDVL